MNKSIGILAFALSVGPLTAAPQSARASQDQDLAAVMRVVSRSPAPSPLPAPAQEVRKLTILLRDKDEGEVLRLSLPFKLIEWVAELNERSDLGDYGLESDVKLRDIIKTLKSLGPSKLLEIDSRDGLIRIWLE